ATRPTVAQVYRYRAHVDEHMRKLLSQIGGDREHPAYGLVELGLQHEQQHQELILTDIKHVFWMNPMRPAYVTTSVEPARAQPPLEWEDVSEGLYHIGHSGPGFAYDNETPQHRVFLQAFQLGSRLVTNGEFLE